MIWLEAVLAFAITMLVFSTMVSVIVEAGLRVLQMREKGFRDMLKNLFEDVVEPRLGEALVKAEKPDPSSSDPPNTKASPSRLARLRTKLALLLPHLLPEPKTVKPDTERFLKTLTRNRAMGGERGGLFRTLRQWFVPRENTSMTVMQFAERLADTEAGQAIARQGEERMAVLIKDLAQKFENFGEGAREYYARRAAMISMVVAIVFAYGANIDALRLFKTFVTDRQLTAGIIERSEQVRENYKTQQERLDALLKQITSESGDSMPTNADPVTLDQLKTQARELRTELTGLAEQGLPITYSFYPVCSADSLDEKCIEHRNHLNKELCPTAVSRGTHANMATCLAVESSWWWTLYHSRFRGAGWFMSVLLAGLLIGLGGPFWYNVVSSLGRVVQLTRAVGLGGKPKPQAAAPETATGVAKSDQPQTPVEAFKIAAQAIRNAPTGNRAILAPSGAILRE